MSDLFGEGGTSLTASIFGESSSNNDDTLNLFSNPSQPSITATTLPSHKRPRICNGNAPPVEKTVSREEILSRRKKQSTDDILDQLTISLQSYKDSINNEELYGDVRGLMKHHGLVIIRDALSKEDVDTITKLADATQQMICNTLNKKDIPYNKLINNTQAICYEELAIRCQGRMDVRYKEKYDKNNDDNTKQDNGQLPDLSLIDNLAAEILHGAEPPKLTYSGWIFSFPNSADQPYHQDGSPLFENGTESLPSYAINVFVGLHDAEELLTLGPTEFVVGSHHMTPDSAMNKVDGAVSAVIGKGDILLYDYRICHRGTSNLSSDNDEDTKKAGKGSCGIIRKVLYLMYARPWFREHLNFGEKSLFE